MGHDDEERVSVAGQRAHWNETYRAHPDMYGLEPSEPSRYAIATFRRYGIGHVLELGAGQGRDTLAFLHAGFNLTALDFSADGLAELRDHATAAGMANRLTTRVSDAREPLALPDAVDAVYSHMLLSMAFTTVELEHLTSQIHRVLCPGGWHIYTVRHTGDAHYRAGTDHGDDRWENGGFVVHFFDRSLVHRLATGWHLVECVEFTEGELPRRLWRVTLRRPSHDAR